jgi:hypothetical protein
MEEYKEHNSFLEQKTKEDRLLLLEGSTQKMKGRILINLLKKRIPNSRLAFLRWYVRTNRALMYKSVSKFILNSRASERVCFYRFKHLTKYKFDRKVTMRNFLHKLDKFFTKIMYKGSLKDVFFKIRLQYELKKV